MVPWLTVLVDYQLLIHSLSILEVVKYRELKSYSRLQSLIVVSVEMNFEIFIKIL